MTPCRLYVPLWCKSNGSFLEGASHPEELVEQAAALGLPALALTDRDGVYGIVRAHVQAQERGMPLHRRRAGHRWTTDVASRCPRIVLLAQDRRATRISAGCSPSAGAGSRKASRVVTWDEVCEHAGGLLALWGGDTSLLVREPDPDDVAGHPARRVRRSPLRDGRASSPRHRSGGGSAAARAGRPLSAARSSRPSKCCITTPTRRAAAGRDDVHPSRRHDSHRRHGCSSRTPSMRCSSPTHSPRSLPTTRRRSRARARSPRAARSR